MIGKIKDTLTVKYLCVKERVKSHFVNLWKREGLNLWSFL